VVLENHFRPRLRGLARAHHRDRALLSGHALNQSLNCAARGLVTAETSLDHERVVHDEEIARAEELLSAGLDVPQVTRIAMRLREQGLAIDPAVYTVEALERELLALRRGETGC
jgi:aryl carrier-like protein